MLQDFAHYQKNTDPRRNLSGIVFVIAFHAVLVYALVTGLGHKMIEIVKVPIETKLIEEAKKAPEDKPAAPPPKLAPPPPAYIPPPEINIALPPPSANTITQVTNRVAPPPPPPPPPAPKAVVRTDPVIDANRSCPKPEYPAASRRLEESGTVAIRFLIGVEGQVMDSQIEKSSGFVRLDEAARQGLARCKFKPGTVDGKPEQSWGRVVYRWNLTD